MDDTLSWVSLLVSVATLGYLAVYTNATKDILKYQILPKIDVNLGFSNATGKSYFWFLNNSDLPGYVSIKAVSEGSDPVSLSPLRIPPNSQKYYRFRNTAAHYEFDKSKELTVHVVIRPAFDDESMEIGYSKSYRFDGTKNQWNETTWSWPDDPLPGTT